MERDFNHEESLSLINEMISQARNNVKTGSTYSMMYWGYATAALAIINYVLLHTLSNPNQSFWIWCFMLPAGLGSYFIERRIRRKALVKTHIDKIGGMVWCGFLISFSVFEIVINTVGFRLGIYQVFMLTTPVIMIMVGMGEFISACIYRHKMWYVIAALVWMGAIVCAFLNVDMQFIVFAACMILGFVVPGHILNRQAKKSCLKN
jgi:MFS family permease